MQPSFVTEGASFRVVIYPVSNALIGSYNGRQSKTSFRMLDVCRDGHIIRR